ncbi:MAG: HEAT repeat domain-containing protein [Planctomycetota bacterium]
MKPIKPTYVLSFFFLATLSLLMLWIVPELLILRFFQQLSMDVKQGEVEKLFQGLRHPKQKVVKNTFDLIEICVPNEKNLDCVCQHLSDPNPVVRIAAVRLLGKYREKGSIGVPTLIQNFEKEERILQYFILQTLEQIGPGSGLAVVLLTEMLQDKEINFRKKSAEALIAIGSIAGTALPRLVLCQEIFDTDQSVFENALESVGPAKSESIPEFLVLLKESSAPKIIQRVLRQLSRMGPEGKSALNRVLEYLQAEPIVLRCLALEAIANFGVKTQEVQEAVLLQLQAHEGDVRQTACLAIQRVGSRRLIPQLEAIARKDPDSRFRDSLKIAIEKLQEQSE